MTKEPKNHPKAQTELTDEELDCVAGGAPNVVYAPAGAGAGAQDTDFDPRTEATPGHPRKSKNKKLDYSGISEG
jgi:predicted ribosomally synthesized peptide with nif11-like leader